MYLHTSEEVGKVLEAFDFLWDSERAPSAESSAESSAEASQAGSRRRRRTWEEEDDLKISFMVSTYGFRWRIIARELGTTDDAVRNRWKRILEIREAATLPPRPPRPIPTRERRRGWTKEEDAALRLALETDTLDELHLPGRDRSTWRNRIFRAGMTALYDKTTRRRGMGRPSKRVRAERGENPTRV